MDQQLEHYFRDLSRVDNEVLEREEEKKLTKRVEAGDRGARERLVEHNLRLVVDVAKNYRELGLEYSDLIQAGNLALLRAVDKFDPGMDNKLSTYAYWWIRQSILKALDNHSRTVKVPAYMSRLKRKIGQFTEDYKKREGEEPSVKELSKNLDDSEEKIKLAIRSGRGTKSLDKPLGEDRKGETLAEIIEEKKGYSPREKGKAEIAREKLYRLLEEELTDREKQIIKLRYGLEDYNPRTLKEVARVFDLSAECIRQLQNRALDKLKGGELTSIPAGKI